MAALAPTVRLRGRGIVLASRPVPIVIDAGSLVPVAALGGLFALYTSGARASLLIGAALLGGLGGALSLIVHELGHVRAARHLSGVRPVRVSLIWMGAGTEFEGAYRSGRDQARVAIAGPAASFLFALLLVATAVAPMPRPLQYGLFGLALLNLAIAALSLLPVYPLDGHKLVVGVLWRLLGSERRARAIVRRAGKAWLGAEALAVALLLLEKPEIGLIALVAAIAVYLQKHLGPRRRILPKSAV